jgi:hypothetical protein
LLILLPLCGQHGRCQIGNPLIPAVQIPRTTSVAGGGFIIVALAAVAVGGGLYMAIDGDDNSDSN